MTLLQLFSLCKYIIEKERNDLISHFGITNIYEYWHEGTIIQKSICFKDEETLNRFKDTYYSISEERDFEAFTKSVKSIMIENEAMTEYEYSKQLVYSITFTTPDKIEDGDFVFRLPPLYFLEFEELPAYQ